MNLQIDSKINQLLQQHKPGTVLVQSWLEKQGYNRQLIQSYMKSAWLQRLGQGAFIRKGEQILWPGALYAMQKELGLPVHIGGKTALQQLGYSHFINVAGEAPVFLYSHGENCKLRLPKWFSAHRWDVTVSLIGTQLFQPETLQGLTERLQASESFSLLTSSPERAMLELLHLVPNRQSLEEAYYFMEGLTTLVPELLQSLLENCQSHKVKRLFLLLAEECQHAWFNYLDLTKIDLGKGKRKIGQGGKFYTKYNLSIPPLPQETSSDEIP